MRCPAHTMASSVPPTVTNSRRCAHTSTRAPPTRWHRRMQLTRSRRSTRHPPHRLLLAACAARPVVTSCNFRPRCHRSDAHRHEPSDSNHLEVSLATRRSQIRLRRTALCAAPSENIPRPSRFCLAVSSACFGGRTIRALLLVPLPLLGVQYPLAKRPSWPPGLRHAA